MDNLELDKVVGTSLVEVVAFVGGASQVRSKILEILGSQRDSQVVDKVVGTLMELKPWSVGIP